MHLEPSTRHLTSSRQERGPNHSDPGLIATYRRYRCLRQEFAERSLVVKPPPSMLPSVPHGAGDAISVSIEVAYGHADLRALGLAGAGWPQLRRGQANRRRSPSLRSQAHHPIAADLSALRRSRLGGLGRLPGGRGLRPAAWLRVGTTFRSPGGGTRGRLLAP